MIGSVAFFSGCDERFAGGEREDLDGVVARDDERRRRSADAPFLLRPAIDARTFAHGSRLGWSASNGHGENRRRRSSNGTTTALARCARELEDAAQKLERRSPLRVTGVDALSREA